MKDLRVELLAKTHDRDGFRCESEALTAYIATQARQDVRRQLSARFVLTQGTPQVLGFYTLSTDSIPRTEVPAALRKTLPKSYRAPVILLGRLARDLSSRGQGLGELLLMDALLRCLWLSDESVGAMAVVVRGLVAQSVGDLRRIARAASSTPGCSSCRRRAKRRPRRCALTAWVAADELKLSDAAAAADVVVALKLALLTYLFVEAP